MTGPQPLISMTPQEIREYLDEGIMSWRSQRDQAANPGHESGDAVLHAMARYYIDAFQSVRSTLFGETLP